MTKQKYYTLIFLGSDGKRKLKEVEVAKVFFHQNFADLGNINSVSDIFIQKQLWELSQHSSSQLSLLAQRCLLCFISWQIEQACLSLEQQFGNFHGFTSRDLLGYVLDDDGSVEVSQVYRCLGREILASFDPDKSSLTTWTSRKVRQHKELNQYLLECGLYLVSDWAILNDTKVQQVANILGGFHYLTNLEIEETKKLLIAYHKVYRAERLRQRAEGKPISKCNPPTNQELQAILENLPSEISNNLSTKTIMQRLQTLAGQLREYRLHMRNSCFKTVSLDAELNDNSTFIEQLSAPNSQSMMTQLEEVDETSYFLKTYRVQLENCLDSAFQTVITSRTQKFQKKDTEKAKQFLAALQLFHCQRLSMGKIAKQLNLRAQDAVARLLKLKEFRADVRQEALVKLQPQVIELAQQFSTPTRLVNLEAKISDLLDEQIGNLVVQAEIEAASMQNNCKVSYFSHRLCQQLDSLSRSSVQEIKFINNP